jgi:heme/copper-type cytochrome/quinol oxidase subunit 1
MHISIHTKLDFGNDKSKIRKLKSNLKEERMEKIGIFSIVFLITVFNYYFFRIVFDYIIKEKYGDLVFILIFVGIFIMLFGYWSKWKVYSFNRASQLVEETSIKTRKKIELNEKLTLNERINLWIEDGYGVKLCNKIGAIMIVLAIVVFILKG